MSLKCVSKQWLSFITSSHFRSSLPPLRASALFIHYLPKHGRPDKLHFISLDNPQTPSPFERLRTLTLHSFDSRKFRILHSCNGLLLVCATRINALYDYMNCYVCDSSTKQLHIIPLHSADTLVRYVGLAFDPLKSLHYKVIAFVYARGFKNVGDFHIYSSETGTWRVSVQSFNSAPYLNFTDGVYWNGCVHWLGKLSVSDCCLCFNMDEERLETFPRPPASEKSLYFGNLYFGESEGHLHVIEVFPFTTSLKVYEMKSDYSGWFVKYRVNLASISKVFREVTQHKNCCGKNHIAVAVHSLIRRENFRRIHYWYWKYLQEIDLLKVLEGLVYLHEQGVIHRDIKGAIIFLTKEGLLKLANLGVATKLTEADVNTHSVVGKPYWMAPRYFSCNSLVIEMSGVCAASDIWSVGCTVIELQPMPALFRIR